jgi:hypothetical protein
MQKKTSGPEQPLYDELSLYTLEKADPEFIHQLIVDAFTAQNAGEQTKPIAITFALIGLYLVVEKGYTGKAVQNVHVRLARTGAEWPSFSLPSERGSIRVIDVLATPACLARDEMIRSWCQSVWDAWKGTSRDQVMVILREKAGID